MSEKTYTDRRTVLRATGGLLGLTAAAGTASAVCYEVEVGQYPADVYDDCDGDYIGYVSEGSGVTCRKCYDANGDTWWRCDWTSATPDGWVHDDQVIVHN